MSEDPETCPHCGVDLRDKEIPREYLEAGHYGPWTPGDPPRYYMRTIMVEIRGVYDGGLFWQCPDCGGRWHRWPEGHYLRAKAESYMEGAHGI